MSRIFIDGFESGTLDCWTSGNEDMDTSNPVTGAYALGTMGSASKTFSSSPGHEVYIGFNAYTHLNAEAITGGSVALILSLGLDSGESLFKYYIIFKWSYEYVVFGYGTGSYAYNFPAYTLVSLASMDLSSYVNNYQVRILQNADLSILLQLRINGGTVVNDTVLYSYIYLANSYSNIASFYLEPKYESFSVSRYWLTIDDVVVDDSDWPGYSRILGLSPSADSSVQWDRYPAGAASNAACVLTADDGNTVYSNTALDEDLYTLTDLPAGASTVKSVSVLTRAKTPGSPNYEYIQLSIKTLGTTYRSASKIMTYNYKGYFEIWENNPSTGIGWTVSQVNALEAGIRLAAS